MTVQELINQLQAVEDKEKRIVFYDERHYFCIDDVEETNIILRTSFPYEEVVLLT